MQNKAHCASYDAWQVSELQGKNNFTRVMPPRIATEEDPACTCEAVRVFVPLIRKMFHLATGTLFLKDSLRSFR